MICSYCGEEHTKGTSYVCVMDGAGVCSKDCARQYASKVHGATISTSEGFAILFEEIPTEEIS